MVRFALRGVGIAERARREPLEFTFSRPLVESPARLLGLLRAVLQEVWNCFSRACHLAVQAAEAAILTFATCIAAQAAVGTARVVEARLRCRCADSFRLGPASCRPWMVRFTLRGVGIAERVRREPLEFTFSRPLVESPARLLGLLRAVLQEVWNCFSRACHLAFQ